MWETRASPKFNAAKIEMLKSQKHALKREWVWAYDVKIHLFSQESKNKILRGYCGGRLVTKIIKVKLIGPVAYPRMQIYPRRPISDCWGNQTKGRVNIMKGEFSIRLRTKSFSAI